MGASTEKTNKTREGTKDHKPRLGENNHCDGGTRCTLSSFSLLTEAGTSKSDAKLGSPRRERRVEGGRSLDKEFSAGKREMARGQVLD